MSNRCLNVLLICAGAAILIVTVLFYNLIKSNDNQLEGRLVFANSIDLGESINEINITTMEDEVELVLDNGYWLVKNKGKYYADFGLMHKFLTNVNNASYVSKLLPNDDLLKNKFLYSPHEAKKKEYSGMLIEMKADGKETDETTVGLPDEQNKFYFLRNKNNEIWLVDGEFNLPVYAKDWLLRHIISVDSKHISTITINDKSCNREISGAEFFNDDGERVNVMPLAEVLSGVMIEDAKQKDVSNMKTPQKTITVTTFQGLKVVFDVFYDNDDVWFLLNLLTTPLPRSTINDYIQDNRFLYDGWLFKAAEKQKHIWKNFYLM